MKKIKILFSMAMLLFGYSTASDQPKTGKSLLGQPLKGSSDRHPTRFTKPTIPSGTVLGTSLGTLSPRIQLETLPEETLSEETSSEETPLKEVITPVGKKSLLSRIIGIFKHHK